jgi:hypothetical protein
MDAGHDGAVGWVEFTEYFRARQDNGPDGLHGIGGVVERGNEVREWEGK